ncbi:MAG: dethiobiotin synthase [Pirellulaceae bacterium]|nr:dethiobiotin synthase [Pirellulaceae bacterium]
MGKTYAAALITEALVHSGVNVGVYKPVASGCRLDGGKMIADDALKLWESAGKPLSLDAVCPQKFLAPLAPPAAAADEGRSVNAELLRNGAVAWESNCDWLIIEGAGGLFSPLAEGVLNIDLFLQFDNAQLVLVASNRLGVIHQTLATCAAAERQGVTVAGIILCCPQERRDDSADRNAAEIAKYTDVPVWAEIAFGQKTYPGDLSFFA